MIYLAQCSAFSPAFFDAAAQWIPREKRAPIAAIRHEQTRRQSALGWSMLTLMRTKAGLPTDAPLRFAGGKKPFFDDAGFHFNLSHSGDFVCLAVDDAPIGVDVETRRTPSPALLRRVLAQSETAAVQAADDPSLAFTTLWTYKESLLKQRGTGIVAALDALDFSIHLNEAAFFAFDLWFSTFRLPQAVVTACSGKVQTAPQHVTPKDFSLFG